MFKVAIIGSGLIGSSWAIAFAKSGYEVNIYDKDEKSFSKSKEYIEKELKLINGVDYDATIKSISYTQCLTTAVDGVQYIQESIFETLEAKKEIFSQLDKVVDENTILGSSSSSLPCSAFTEELIHKAQCVVSHPVNPPHLIPLVEIVPAPWTDPKVSEKAMEIMDSIGQTPVFVNKEIEGFILNRLQGALLNEAWALYQEGYASVEVIDKTVRDGLSHRWSFMGPFQTISHNAPGGIVDYVQRFGGFNFSIAKSRSNPEPWLVESAEKAAVEIHQLEKEMGLDTPVEWRNNMLRSFKDWKEQS